MPGSRHCPESPLLIVYFGADDQEALSSEYLKGLLLNQPYILTPFFNILCVSLPDRDLLYQGLLRDTGISWKHSSME